MVTAPPKTNRKRPSTSNAAVMARLVDLERYARTHGESLSALTSNLEEHDLRLKTLEGLAQIRAIAEAREDERDKNLYARLDRMDAQIHAIKGEGENSLETRLISLTNSTKVIGDNVKSLMNNRNWIVVIVVGAVLTALVSFVIKGGTFT